MSRNNLREIVHALLLGQGPEALHHATLVILCQIQVYLSSHRKLAEPNQAGLIVDEIDEMTINEDDTLRYFGLGHVGCQTLSQVRERIMTNLNSGWLRAQNGRCLRLGAGVIWILKTMKALERFPDTLSSARQLS